MRREVHGAVGADEPGAGERRSCSEEQGAAGYEHAGQCAKKSEHLEGLLDRRSTRAGRGWPAGRQAPKTRKRSITVPPARRQVKRGPHVNSGSPWPTTSSTCAPTPSPSPSPEMRHAMADAEVGDDVFGDDPTVIALEERAAELTGKEAALFVASGTMGNLVVAHGPGAARRRDHRRRRQPHVRPRGGQLRGRRGREHEAAAVGRERPHGSATQIRAAFRNPLDVHEPITSLVMLENTHSDSMAAATARRLRRGRGRIAHEGGVPLHVDGARIFNASVALGTPVERAARRRPTRPPSACRRASPVQSARSSSARRSSSGARAGHARWSAAACARWASSPRPGLIALRDGSGGHDRAPGRRSRQRTPPRRRDRRHARRGRARPGSRAHELRLLRAGAAGAAHAVPRRARQRRAC